MLATYAHLMITEKALGRFVGDETVLEEYLIDFSKKIEGHRLSTGPLPSDLNAENLFSIRSLLLITIGAKEGKGKEVLCNE